jgi:glycosyltransferase involved in cell wall biosynthesis
MAKKINSAGIIFHKYGPYHIARIKAVADFFATTGFELSSLSNEYKWDEIKDAQSFKRVTIFNNENSRNVSLAVLKRKLYQQLNANTVEVMLINGWGDKGGLLTLNWCLRNKIPAIVMTEEVADTMKRKWLKEYPKKKIVQLFDAALVGGKSQVKYIKQLGMPDDLIETGYDAVDNHYFAKEATAARKDQQAIREKYKLPQHFFLTSNRFIEKKNLFRLLEAYKKYTDIAKGNEWHLVMLGDGPLNTELQEKIKLLCLTDYVIMPGFLQYNVLPHYYALADVFIHASTSEQWGLVVNEAMAASLPVIVSDKCGCCEDLVENGRNGFSFDPYNIEDLSKKMDLMSRKNKEELKMMGLESARIVNKFAPENFGTAVKKLIKKIDTSGSRAKSRWNRFVLNLIIHLISN